MLFSRFYCSSLSAVLHWLLNKVIFSNSCIRPGKDFVVAMELRRNFHTRIFTTRQLIIRVSASNNAHPCNNPNSKFSLSTATTTSAVTTPPKSSPQPLTPNHGKQPKCSGTPHTQQPAISACPNLLSSPVHSIARLPSCTARSANNIAISLYTIYTHITMLSLRVRELP